MTDRTQKEIEDNIKDIIEKQIMPAVQHHGGIVKLESFDKDSGIVTMLMSGSCSGCASSAATLKMGIENMLKHYIPEVKSVEGVDDPNFNDPYYKPRNDGRGYAVWDETNESKDNNQE